MKLIQDHPGYYWHTDDAARLHIDNAQPTPPEKLNAFRIGHVCLVLSSELELEPAKMEYLGQGFFGPARGNRIKWTGDCYKFGIYRYEDRAVILRTDGGGSYLYYIDQTDAGKVWAELCNVLSSSMLWDVCQTVAHTYDEGRKAERRKLHTLFLAGRLKKRKRQGRLSVEIVAA